jgi:hypothetical protein
LHTNVALQAPLAPGLDGAFEVADDAVKITLLGAVDFGVAGGGAGVERMPASLVARTISLMSLCSSGSPSPAYITLLTPRRPISANRVLSMPSSSRSLL